MSEVIDITARRDAVEGQITEWLSAAIVTALCRALAEDDAIDTGVLPGAVVKAKTSIGSVPARFCFHTAWSSAVDTLLAAIREAVPALRAGGAFVEGLEEAPEPPL
jgi:hypothetical protein